MADDIVDPGDLDSPQNPDEPNATPATPPERPRNPDGTFAAFAEHIDPPEADPLAHLPPSLVEEARDFGFDDDEIAGMSLNVLHKTLWKTKQRIQQVRQQAQAFRVRDEARVQHDPRVKPVAPAGPDEDDDFDLGEDTEELHPAVIKTMKRLGAGYKKEIKALKGELAQRDQRDQERSARRSVAMIDAAFAQLPEYEKLYGKGAGSGLGPDSATFKRRLAVLREAGVNANDPVSVIALKQQIKEATDTLFGLSLGKDENPYAATEGDPKPAKPAKSNGRITREEWDDAALARPTQRKVDDRPRTNQEREARAVANLHAKLNGKGGDHISDAEELDGFPD